MARLFLLEAVALALAGGAGVGVGARQWRRCHARWSPACRSRTPLGAVVAALAMSLVVGVARAISPARRAAGLDPVEALRAE